MVSSEGDTSHRRKPVDAKRLRRKLFASARSDDRFLFSVDQVELYLQKLYYKITFNKKDGYRQQNVRQRQKLISIIDYDVCILEYLQPFYYHQRQRIA